MAPDVDPVGEVHQRVASARERLGPVLPVEAGSVFEPDDSTGVLEGDARASGRQVPHREVGEDRQRDQRDLADHLTSCERFHCVRSSLVGAARGGIGGATDTVSVIARKLRART
jgi:hypothetical protein